MTAFSIAYNFIKLQDSCAEILPTRSLPQAAQNMSDQMEDLQCHPTANWGQARLVVEGGDAGVSWKSTLSAQ